MGDFWDDDRTVAMRRMLGAMLVAVYVVALLIAALAIVTRPARAETLTAASGYKLTYDVYKPDANALPVAVIFMHGKNAAHDTTAMRSFARGLADSGITVYAPAMPWSKKWNGTAADAASAIDGLVALAAEGGKKVVVGGQSMGASFALAWRPADAPPSVAGKLLTSPGHLLDITGMNAPFWKTIMPGLTKARAMIAEGKGDSMARFEGANTSGESAVLENYEMRAEVFASLHDPKTYPSIAKALETSTLPVYWSVGTRDPVGNGKKQSFDKLPPNDKSVYSEISGDHNSVMRDALPDITKWLKTL